MYSAKINFFKPTVKEGNRDLKEKWLWLGRCVVGVGRGRETREKGFGEIGGKERGGFKNIKHLFLPLC